MKILAVIPAHNEAKNIAAVTAAVKALGHDVLVVDDGSTDGTAAMAKSAGAVVLATGKKSGKGSALRVGFEHAVNNGYGAVIALDGDGQHDPRDIKAFLECRFVTNADVINGNRMGDPRGMPAVRLATNAFMSWVISMICGQRIPDTQCGFRFITTDVLKNIELQCSDFEIETELLIKASKQGYKIASVPVTTIYRDEVSKIKPLRDTWRFIVYLLREFSKT